MTLSERNPTDEIALAFDQFNPFSICGSTFTPIYRGSPVVECSFCKTSYLPQFKGRVCESCLVGGVGGVGTGLRNGI